MQTKKKQIDFSTIAFGLGIAGLICNLIFISYDGVPMSIACAIMAIAFAIASKGETGKMPPRSRTAVIMAVVALVFGVIIYELVYTAYHAMSDPATSKIISSKLQEMMQQLPPEMQGVFQ